MRMLAVLAVLATSSAAAAEDRLPYEEIVLETFARAGDIGALDRMMLTDHTGCIPSFPLPHMDPARTSIAFAGVSVTVLHLQPVWDATLRRGQAMKKAGCVAPDELRFVTLIARLRIVERETHRTFEAKARLDVMASAGTWFLRHPPFDFYEIGTLGAVFARDREINADLLCTCQETGCFAGGHSQQYELETQQPADAIIEPIAPRYVDRIRAATRRGNACVTRAFARFNRERR